MVKSVLSVVLVVFLGLVAGPGLAQDKKVEPAKDAPKAAPTEDDKKDAAKGNSGAKAAAKSDEQKKDPKKKERKGGC